MRRSLCSVLGVIVSLLAACGGDSEGGAANGVTSLGGNGGQDASTVVTGSGGVSGSNGSTTTTGGGGEGVGGVTPGSGGGLTTGSGGSVEVPVDAAVNLPSGDAASEAPRPPPVCLSANEDCSADAGLCCEAYVCRLGKCCTPTGIRSNCIRGTDCCSGSCILNQCTCVPKGYTCNGPGSCCGGLSCVNRTCICPPDIRGCQ